MASCFFTGFVRLTPITPSFVRTVGSVQVLFHKVSRYCFIRPVCPGYTAYSPHSKPPSVGITLSICSKLSLVRPIPACSGWLYQTQRWAAALDSIALKCISCKILPCRARVIFRKKRWKSLIRHPYTASVNPKRFGRKKNRKKGK